MKLRALDQIHVSAVKPDSLRPREEFEVSDAMAAELLEKHPTKFEPADGKALSAPKNKAETAAPANKAASKGKGKA